MDNQLREELLEMIETKITYAKRDVMQELSLFTKGEIETVEKINDGYKIRVSQEFIEKKKELIDKYLRYTALKDELLNQQ